MDIAVTNASPPSSLVDVRQLAAALERFAAERNWAQFHSPKNLVMALTGEVGELSEIFQWMDEEQSKDAARHPDTAQAVQDELADVLMYLVRLASVLGVDLDAAARQKLEQNNRKYPVEKARNSSKKYDQF
nr:nucleotide pyrophosphohydrolase [Pseudomonas aeruginosa]